MMGIGTLAQAARWLRVSKHPELAIKAKHEAARRAERAPGHAEQSLPSVTVDTYNEELRDEEGFVGDRASGRAFRAILDDRGFSAAPRIGTPGEYVFERAFVEK